MSKASQSYLDRLVLIIIMAIVVQLEPVDIKTQKSAKTAHTLDSVQSCGFSWVQPKPLILVTVE